MLHHRMVSLCLKTLAVLLSIAFVCPAARAQTDENGFFTEYLVAAAYAGPGCNPNQLVTADFLCDGDSNENNIIPEEGFILMPPVLEAEDCEGGTQPALFGTFHLNTPIDLDGNLPIVVQMTEGDLLNFETQAPGADNAMGYAWVYVENVTGAPLDLRMGIASDDSIQVKVNRIEVFNLGVCRGWGGAGTTQNDFPVTLQPGGNLVQFKVWDGGGGWGMRARFVDPGGCGNVRSGEGQIEVGVEPIDLWQSPAERSLESEGTAPGEVTVNVSVTINADDAYNLEENYDRAWTASDINPEPTANEAGRLYWEGITAASVSYTLTRSGAWTVSNFAGTATIGGDELTVGGASSLSSGLVGHVGEILLTPAYTMSGGVQGCNITADQMDGPWINDADEINDEWIIPEEGLIFGIDYEGESQISGIGVMSPEAEALFVDAPGDPFSESILVRATSADGFYDFQRADIFGTNVEQVMCAAFFYAVNDSDEPIQVGIGFGSDDAGTVRVNGRPVITTPRCAGHPGFTDKGTAQLDPGKNLISVYTFENGGGYNMCIRFEDENFEPLPIPTTIDPTGYEPGPDAHPEPEPAGGGDGEFEIINSPFIRQVLMTPAYTLASWNGCNIPIDVMATEWISDIDGEIADETIIPEDGLIFTPDYGGSAPEISGLTNLGGAATEKFWTGPDPFTAESILAPASSPNGVYDLQGGNIFAANVELCMCVAYTYVINDSDVGRCIQLGIGSDDSISVKVNGRPAGAFQRCAPHNPFSFKVPVWLDPGKNLVAIATYENGGGYIMCARFEDENGTPIDMPHTIDPTGYDPGEHEGAADGCSNAPVDPAPYLRGGPSKGFITEWLVGAQPFDSVAGGNAPAQAFIEDYVSQNGGPPDIDSIYEGAIVESGISGLISAGVRDSVCGFTTLTRVSAYDINPGDPGLFNGESYYGGGDNYTAVMFAFVNNVSNDDLQAWFGLASDDAATLYVNGEVAVEFLTPRGFGAANEIQTRASSPALLEPGLNLVMLGYNEAGGGSGARIAMFSDSCFKTPFTEDEVSVTADNPEFGGGGGDTIGATRSIEPANCDGISIVTITFNIPGDQAVSVTVNEGLPENTTGENPSAGEFNDAGSALTFTGEVSNGDAISYEIADGVAGASFCLGTVDGMPILGDTVLREGAALCDFSGELYINCGGPEFVDALGRVWLEDTIENPSPYLVSPNVHTANFGLGFAGVDVEADEYIFDNAIEQDIFPAERWDDGDVVYEFTGLPPGTYEVVLLFAEFCCSNGCQDIDDPQQSGGPCRVFDAYINGEQILDQFAQAVEAARLVGVDPAGTAGYRIGLSVVEEVTTNGTIEIMLNDLGGGNPPENAGIKGIMLLSTDGPAPVPDEICDNGTDDDRDGDVDCDDSDCSELAVCIPDEICDNGIDDDRDGAADCDDNDCVDDANCAGPGEPTFVRGDSNSDGSVNLTDGVIPLLFLFSGGAAPACLDSADTNDTGSVEITDAIIIFSWLFSGGAAPADPSPASPGYSPADCGVDATADGIGCDLPSPVCE